jgi:lipoprotein NlpI
MQNKKALTTIAALHTPGLADYDSAIQTDPKYARTYLLRGVLALHKGQTESAQKDFDTGFKLDPQLHGEFDPIINQIKASRGIK